MKVQVINKSDNKLPAYETIGAAGLDVRANLENIGDLKGSGFRFNRISQNITILPGGRVLIPTGLYFALPEGTHLDVRPRSGLALKFGVTVLNTPGLIDEDYRGELGVILINLSNSEQVINHGDRIAQVVLMKSEKIEWNQVETLDETARGAGGFGHTTEKEKKVKKAKEETKITLDDSSEMADSAPDKTQ